MAQAMLSFNQTAAQIESSILQAIAENEARFKQLQASASSLTPEGVIQTLEAMDANLGQACASVQHMFNVSPRPEFLQGYMAAASKLSAYVDSITQNKWLQDYCHKMANAQLPTEHKAIFKQYQQTMQAVGYHLQSWERKLLAQTNAALNTALELFESNIQQATVSVSHADEAIILDDNALNKILSSESDVKLRQQAYDLYYHKTANNHSIDLAGDNRQVVVDILNLRRQIAKIQGYNSYWDFSLASKSLNDSQKILDFLQKITQRCIPKCRSILQEISQEFGLKKSELTPWSIDYYVQMLVKKRYRFQLEQVQKYYSVPSVLQGLSRLTEQLFGIKISRIPAAPTWDKEVIVLAVTKNKQQLGLIYVDIFSRPNKRGSAWLDIAQVRRKLDVDSYQQAILFLTCNFTKTGTEQSTYLSQDNLVSLLHEFGHALHHMLAESAYAGLAGTQGVALDEVEIPSLLFEKFAFEKSFLHLFAKDDKTLEVMPESFIAGLKAAYQFIAPIKLVQRLKLALLDYRLHDCSHPITSADVEETVIQVEHETQIFPEIHVGAAWYKSASLIFTSQYAAGYYSYLWAEIIAADWFANLFGDEQINPEKGELLTAILAPGGMFDLTTVSQKVCGRPPSMDAFFTARHIQ